MFRNRQIDATKGPIIRLIIIYTIPLILSTLIQTLFNMVDIAVLGNMADENAVASVGSTSSIVHLVVTSFVGLAAGTRVNLARQIGENDEKQIRNTVDTSLLTALIIGIFVAILGNLCAPWFLNITNCPDDCFEGALIYLRIYISASPAILLYNFGSAVLTTSGDTQRPLYYIIIGGLTNIILNIILCLILPQKVIAVAVATVASQVIGASLVLLRLCRMDGVTKVVIKKLRMNFSSFAKLIRYGLPVAFTHALYPLANLQIQSAVNSYGVSAIAGSSAASTIDGITSSFGAPFGNTAMTFVGQNIGAQKPERVNKSIIHSLWLVLLFGGTMGIFFFSTGEFWLSLILKDNTAAIEYGMIKLSYVSLFYGIAGLNAVFSNVIQAFGYPVMSTANSIASTLVFRIIWMQLIYPKISTFANVMLCFTVSWSINLLLNILIFAIIKSKYNKGKIKKL